MGRVDGKVIIITGGARGQGAAEAELFRDEGAQVVITDVLEEQGGQTAATLGVDFLLHDVSSASAWEVVVSDVVARHGRIDALINNAGILRGARLVNTSDEIWDQTIAINQTGVFYGMRAVAPQMIEQGAGSIVNISSVAGLEATFASMAYGATKWAVRGMSKIAALELGRHNVRVNSIHPGLINTDFADVKMIMSNAGSALMGIGRAHGENRAENAARQAVSSPLLEASIEGARGILLNVTASENLGLHEVRDAADVIHDVAHPDANIIFGTVIDDSMGEEIRITVIAAGFDRWDDGAAGSTRSATASPLEEIADIFDAEETSDIGIDDDDDDDEFDVPSFLK